MYNNSIKLFFILLLTTFQVVPLVAQETVKKYASKRPKPAFVIHLGGGISTYAAPVNVRRPIELPGSINKVSGAATVRLMWYPKYRLRLGIESGFTNFYTYQIKNGNRTGKVSLDAIPVLIVWSMQVLPRFNIYAGFGSYFLTTHLDYNGKVKSSAMVLGSNIAMSYTLPISRRNSIAAEAKWMNAFETKDAAFSVQVQFVRKLFQWD